MPYMELLYLGIILGILTERFIFPFLDLMQERITYSVTVGATRKQIQAQKIVADFSREYPECSEDVPEKQPAIGFQYVPEDEDEYEEDFNDKLNNN